MLICGSAWVELQRCSNSRSRFFQRLANEGLAIRSDDNGADNCSRSVPARSTTSRSFSATTAGMSPWERASCDCNSNPETVFLSSISIDAEAARSAAVCSRSRRCRAARISRMILAAPETAKLICIGMARPRSFPDCIRGRRVTFGQGLIDHHGCEILVAQDCEGCAAAIGDLDFHPKLFRTNLSAIANAFDATDDQNAHIFLKFDDFVFERPCLRQYRRRQSPAISTVDALLVGPHRIADSVFLQLAIEGGLADAQQLCARQLVAVGDSESRREWRVAPALRAGESPATKQLPVFCLFNAAA